MYNKSQMDILAFLDNYLKESSTENVQKHIREVSSLKFEGTSAKEYFANFHKYYRNDDLNIPETKISLVTIDLYSLLKVRKHFRSECYYNIDTSTDIFYNESKEPSTSYLKSNVFSKYNNYKEEHEICAIN